MASGPHGQVLRAIASPEGAKTAMRDGPAEPEITSGVPVTKAAYVKHFEALQHQSKAQLKRLRQQLETTGREASIKLEQTTELLKQQRLEYDTLKRETKALKRRIKDDHKTAKDQYRAEIKQLKQQLEAARDQSGVKVEQRAQEHQSTDHRSEAEVEQLKRKLETLHSEHTRWEMQGARLNARIQDMSEAELRGLYAAGAKLVGSQTALLKSLQAEVVGLRDEHERFLQRGADQELLTRNREFAATDAAQRQVIQRLEGEVEGLKGRLKLADGQAMRGRR
ncbi:hypothetical protein LTR95_012231 [Oleoguttula sp. CCFEE 5521]